MRRAGVGALLLALVALPSPALAGDVSRSAASWEDVYVPYIWVEAGQPSVRFGNADVPFQELGGPVDSMAATADSAVVTVNDLDDDTDFEGPLVEIEADGTTNTIEKHALGVAIADPLGHQAFWTSRRAKKARLIGYDTRIHARIPGPSIRRATRVFAVDGDVAYLSTSISNDVVRVYSWTVGQTGLTEVPLPSSGNDGGLLGDVHGDLVLSSDFDRTQISDLDGTVLEAVPPRMLGTFSPDARYIGHGGFGGKVVVWDRERDSTVGLRGLGSWRPADFRWDPSGLLVLTAGPKGTDWDDANRARRFVCRLPSGRCDSLPGRSQAYFEPVLPSSWLGQFIPVAPYS